MKSRPFRGLWQQASGMRPPTATGMADAWRELRLEHAYQLAVWFRDMHRDIGGISEGDFSKLQVARDWTLRPPALSRRSRRSPLAGSDARLSAALAEILDADSRDGLPLAFGSALQDHRTASFPAAQAWAAELAVLRGAYRRRAALERRADCILPPVPRVPPGVWLATGFRRIARPVLLLVAIVLLPLVIAHFGGPALRAFGHVEQWFASMRFSIRQRASSAMMGRSPATDPVAPRTAASEKSAPVSNPTLPPKAEPAPPSPDRLAGEAVSAAAANPVTPRPPPPIAVAASPTPLAALARSVPSVAPPPPPVTPALASPTPPAQLARTTADAGLTASWRLDPPGNRATIVLARGSMKTSLELIRLPQGSYTMGNRNSRDRDSRTERKITVKPFFLAATETTQQQLLIVLGDNQSSWPGSSEQERSRLPASGIDWDTADRFCRVVSEALSGRVRSVRLPWEYEWEYAAQLDADSAIKPAAYAVMQQPVNNSQPAPVRSLRPGRRGFYDLLGNVNEWVADTYSENAYLSEGPQFTGSGAQKVVRGGSFVDPAFNVTTFRRVAMDPHPKSRTIGFRTCVTP